MMIRNTFRCNATLATRDEENLAALMAERVKAEQRRLGRVPGAMPSAKPDPTGELPGTSDGLLHRLRAALASKPMTTADLIPCLGVKKNAVNIALRNLQLSGEVAYFMSRTPSGRMVRRWRLGGRA